MNRRTDILSVLGWFLLLSALLVSCILSLCFYQPFYSYEYRKNETAAETGMNAQGMMESTETILDYLQGRRDDVIVEENVYGSVREVFSEKERLHMIDVRDLYRKSLCGMYVLYGLGIIFLMIGLYRSHGHYSIRNMEYGALLVLGIVLVVLVLSLTDFDTFWYQLHTIIFPDNMYWLLDPNVSIMINLFPGTFFFDLVIRIILLYLVFLGIIHWLVKESAC